jgi:pimeloyl-ACP methyl ester carboxylesterase
MFLMMPGARFRHSDRRIHNLFRSRGCSVDIVYTQAGNRLLRSLIVAGKPERPWLVCVHGAPGSCMDFYLYLTDKRLSGHFNMISIDRPGYGFSGLGFAEPSISEQACMIYDVLCKQSIDHQQISLLAHSYGGPIAARIAMDHPAIVSHLWMLAPAIDPEKEKRFPIAKIAHRKPFSVLVPLALQVAAREKLAHAEELRKMRSDWSAITSNVIHMHGTKDSIVPFENLHFSEMNLPNARFTGIALKGENHFFVWTRREMIIQYVLNGSAGAQS